MAYTETFRREAKLWAGVAACAITLCFAMTCTVAAYRLAVVALVSKGNAPLVVSAEINWNVCGEPAQVTVTSNQQVGETVEATIDRAMEAATRAKATQ